MKSIQQWSIHVEWPVYHTPYTTMIPLILNIRIFIHNSLLYQRFSIFLPKNNLDFYTLSCILTSILHTCTYMHIDDRYFSGSLQMISLNAPLTYHRNITGSLLIAYNKTPVAQRRLQENFCNRESVERKISVIKQDRHSEISFKILTKFKWETSWEIKHLNI